MTIGNVNSDGKFVPAKGYTETIAEKDAEIGRLRAALLDIAAIENEQYGPDWEEIDRARGIANAALGDVQQAPPKWPAGCLKPNSCARNMGCMYLKCPHEQDAALQDDIKAALSADPKSLPEAPDPAWPATCSVCGVNPPSFWNRLIENFSCTPCFVRDADSQSHNNRLALRPCHPGDDPKAPRGD